MKRVLFLINTLGNGGAERVLVNLINNIDDRKFDITLKTLFDVGVNKKFIRPGIKYEYVLNKPFKGYNLVFELLPNKIISKYIVKDEYDIIVVYLHGVLTKIISKYSAYQSKKIAWLHADMNISPFLDKFKNRDSINKCFDNYNAIVGVSESVAKSFVDRVGFEKRVFVKYNTFNVDLIEIKSLEKIETNIISSNLINICSVGKLDKVKGYDRLLRVVNKLVRDNIKFKLNIVGEGLQKKVLREYIDYNGLGEYVTLLGFRENPYKYIKNSDLFVCSSLSEGYSSVVVESLILETPVITTLCSGMKDILGEDSQYGVIVENNEEALYKGMKELILNEQKLKYYTQKAKERKKYFDIEKTVKEVERLLEEV